VEAYRQETDIFGEFLRDYTREETEQRLSTSVLYSYYAQWAKDNGYRAMNSKNFVAELRRRYDVRRDGRAGNVVVGLGLSFDPKPPEYAPCG
jgi:putative DNA primase/helicase